MSSNNNYKPQDSWEDIADASNEIQQKMRHTSISSADTKKVGGLNINASSFVPSWLPPSTENAPPPPPPTLSVEERAPPPSAPKTISLVSKNSSQSPKKRDPSPSAATPITTPKATPKPSPKKDTPLTETPKGETSTLAPLDLTEEELEIASEFFGKEHLNLVFIGHVDAGKSTMGGHILLLTGMVDKRTMEKYEKEAKEASRESWYLSWALDTNKEERSKGKTVEVGKAHFETETRKFTILDAPGHKNYVPNMIGGAAQADVAVLVISARKGEFETGYERGGQTREHAMLVKTVGIKKLVVVINKMDDPTVQWEEERYKEIVSKLLPFLKSVGFNPKTDLYFMPVSGYTGVNLKDRVDKKTCPFYDGPSFLEYLDSLPVDSRAHSEPLMMPITDKYKDMGTIVSGKIETGKVAKGDNVMIMPLKRVVEVLNVYDDEVEVKILKSGDNARLKLKGVEDDEIASGFVICDRIKPIRAVTSFEAQLIILECKNIITAGYSAVMHLHTCIEEVTLGALLHLIDKKVVKNRKDLLPVSKKGKWLLLG